MGIATRIGRVCKPLGFALVSCKRHRVGRTGTLLFMIARGLQSFNPTYDIMVDFRIIDTLSMHRHPPKSPRKQGDFGNFERVGVIGKCLLISLIHHSSIESALMSILVPSQRWVTARVPPTGIRNCLNGYRDRWNMSNVSRISPYAKRGKL